MSALTTTARPVAMPVPPTEVQLSTLSWVGAVAAGGVETVLAVARGLGSTALGPLAAEVGVHVVAFGVLLALAGQLWRGHNWARWTLAGVFGVAGQTSMLVGPIGWLADHRLADLHVDGEFVAFASVRTAHVACVIAAIVLMFAPASSRYLRPSGRGTR